LVVIIRLTEYNIYRIAMLECIYVLLQETLQQL